VTSSDPKRLTVVGATDLERTLLQAARRDQPPPELTARMAAGLGISIGAAVTAASVPAAAAPVMAAKTTVGAWLAAGAIAAAVTAGVVGVRLSARTEAPAVKASEAAAPAAVAPAAEDPVAPAATNRGTRVERPRHRPVAAPSPAVAPARGDEGDLRDQIALIDAARTAVKAGASERALVLLRRYDATYPGGAFRPEALALRIEALDQDGRQTEARALARDFLARYPQSPVADRVTRVAGK
jgi:TolA-binding protein